MKRWSNFTNSSHRIDKSEWIPIHSHEACHAQETAPVRAYLTVQLASAGLAPDGAATDRLPNDAEKELALRYGLVPAEATALSRLVHDPPNRIAVVPSKSACVIPKPENRFPNLRQSQINQTSLPIGGKSDGNLR